jgi:hypothetical protein
VRATFPVLRWLANRPAGGFPSHTAASDSQSSPYQVRERQNGVEPVQRLNGGLLVHTKDGRMLGRVQIQADDVSGFGFEIGIGAGHVSLQAMRLQAGLLPDAVHCVLADTQLSSEFAAAPVCVPSPGFLRVAESIRARSLGVSTEAGCPGWLVSSPPIPEARNRCFHRMTVGAVVLSLR